MDKKIIDTFELNKEKYLEKLKELVRIDTQVIGHGIDGGKEKDGQDYIYKLATEIGASDIIVDHMQESTIEYAIKNFGEGNPGHNYEDRYNQIITFEGENKEKTLMFNGHVDTMPPGNTELWEFDPWSAKEHNGRIYGLGSADMKSGLMASLMAVKLIKDSGIELPINVKIVSVVDEEGGGNGSISVATRGLKADAGIICEPTERNLKRAHMGFVFFEIKTKGRALHSGSKWLGVNAIDKMMYIIQGLYEMEHNWLMEYKHEILPSPTLNVGVIEGGSAGSTVPDECTIKICVHYLPNIMSREKVIKDITEVINYRSDGDKWLRENRPVVNIYQSGGAFETPENAKIVEKAKKSLKKFIPEAEVIGATAGNDARIYANILNIPCVIAGPGHLTQCHSPNEYVSIGEYYEYIKMYADLILNW